MSPQFGLSSTNRTRLCAWTFWWLASVFGTALFAQNSNSSPAVDVQQTPIFQASVQQMFRTYCRPSSVLWRDQPLKPGLLAFQDGQNIELFLDRRVDSSQLLTVGVGADRADLLLKKIAEAAGCKLGFIESVAFIGPVEAVPKIELSYWRAWYQYRKQLIDTKAGGDANKAPQIPVQKLQWDRLATPQDILANIEREWHVEILGKDQVPHDLWDSGSYSTLSLPAQICLVVAGFGLSAEPVPQTNQWKIIPVRDSTTAVLAYAKNQWKAENIEAWGGGTAELSDEEKTTRVRGDVATHYAIALSKYAAALPKPKSRFDNLRFTFEVANTPAADVIDAIALQLQLQPDWQTNRAAVAQRRIGLKVMQVSVKQLMDELAKQSGVTLEVVNESTLTIK